MCAIRRATLEGGANATAFAWRSWAGSYARPISARASLQVTALAVEAPRASVAVSLSLSTAFGRRRSASAHIESNASGIRAGVRAQQTPESTGGLGWRLAAIGGQNARYDAGGYAVTDTGEGELEISKSGASTGLRAGFRGGLALLDGALYAARPLRDAFALAEAPAGMDVMLDNRRVARTGAKGRVLIPDLRANEINRLSVDVDQAPDDAQIGLSELIARPSARGGSRAHFAIQRQSARWVEIVDADGVILPRGALLSRGDGVQFFVGDSGRAYVAMTEREQALTATIGEAQCTIDLLKRGERLICAPQ